MRLMQGRTQRLSEAAGATTHLPSLAELPSLEEEKTCFIIVVVVAALTQNPKFDKK